MTIVRVGATQVYAEGWASAFGKGKKSAVATKVAAKGKATKAAAKKGKRKAKR